MPPFDQTNPDAKALSGLLSARPLQRLIRGAKQQHVLEQLVAEVIPDNIRQSLVSWQLVDQQVVLGVSSASWATRLRAYQNDLLYAADRHRQLGKLTAVKIIVQSTSNRRKKTMRKQQNPAVKPSNQAVNLVKTTANNCEHEALKSALTKLVERMQDYRSG